MFGKPWILHAESGPGAGEMDMLHTTQGKNKCDDGLSRLLVFLNSSCMLREGDDELNFKTLHKSSQVVQISGLSMLASIQNMGTELKML